MRIRTLLFLLLLTLALAGTAHALRRTLTGDATVEMRHFSGESGEQTEKATSLSQQYTVTLSQEDNFFNGRAGSYTLMAGYEINRLNPTFERDGVRDPDLSAIDTDKLYYNGSLSIAPGGLPFRLTLFARDIKRSSFLADTTDFSGFATGKQPVRSGNSSGHLIKPEVYSDISNGTQRVLGGTLLVGIRNGSYLGAYRNILAQLPRLLIDYKQVNVKDLHSSTHKTDFRSRDLAFVSLNKKDNWVHLRRKDHTDFLNPANKSHSSQVMIGTVDHNLQRQWINLTNWIKISSDLSYTDESGAQEIDTLRTYLFNMMVVGYRNNIKTTTFSQFSRKNDGHGVTYDTEIPAAIELELNRDTSLRSRFIYAARESSLLDGQSQGSIAYWSARELGQDRRDFYLDNQFTLQRTRQIIIRPRLEVEARSQDNSQNGLAVRIGAEVLSNRRLNKAVDWLYGYKLTATRTNDEAMGTNNGVLQNEIYGSITRDFSRTLRIGGRSTLATGTEGSQTLGFRIPTTVGGTQLGMSRGDGGRITRGSLNLNIDHRYQRLANRLDLDFVFSLADGLMEKQGSLRHSLNYTAMVHRLKWESTVRTGKNVESPITVDLDFVETNDPTNSDKVSWDSNASYQFDPNRSTGLTLVGAISGQSASADLAYKLSEAIFYRIFTSNGIIRRLVEFNEEIGYEKGDETGEGRGDTLYGRLVATYFPTKLAYGKINSETVRYLGSGTTQQSIGGAVGLDFQKLKISASYNNAYKDRESASIPEIKEQRWDLKVKKIF